MKRFLILTLSVLSLMVVVKEGGAVDEAPKKINLDAQNIARAAQIIRQNQALFNNPEMLERYRRLTQALNKAKVQNRE
jgi:hypothetical protein